MPRTLADCERVIERGYRHFIDVGVALMEISDRMLYRPENGGQWQRFDDYCRDRWGWGRVYAHRVAAAAEAASLLPMGNTKLPSTERQMRELAVLRRDPERLRATWSALAEEVSDPTAELIAAVVERVRRDVVDRLDDLDDTLRAIVRDEVAKLQAMPKALRREAIRFGEAPAPAAATAPPPAYLTLFDVLVCVSKLPAPGEVLKAIPQDCWDQLDDLAGAIRWLVAFKRLWDDARQMIPPSRAPR